MRTEIFERTVELPASAETAFAWHERPGALERLTPPWERVRIVAREGDGLRPGSRVTLVNRVGPLRLRWVAEHREREPGRMFRDVALAGPFAHWDHRHIFEPAGPGRCVLRDRIDFALPGGAAGRLLGGGWVRRRLDALFAYRHAVTRDDLRFALDHAEARPLRVLVSGASGLIGRALTTFLRTQGHEVETLARRERGMLFLPRGGAREGRPWWDPETGEIELGETPFDAVVHLAGAGVADGRWTEARRRVIRDSRVRGTRLLAEALAALDRPPRVVVGGSATGFYGSAGDAWLDEDAPGGSGFLAEVTRDWEAAWSPLEATGARLVLLRTGVVLSPAGGALAKLLPAARLGLGGPVGHGRQWCPWISIDDATGAITHALSTPGLRGPVNAVAPEPARSRDFARTLGGVLRRPAVLPAPAFALRLALGPMVDEALMASQRARPAALAAAGYRFRHENLETALRHLLGRVA